MTRLEALRIHAYHAAAGRISFFLAFAAAALGLVMKFPPVDVIAFAAAVLAFCAMMAALSTDLMSKRIPNLLSVAMLLSAPIWWFAAALGSAVPDQDGLGVARDVLGLILPGQGTGPLVPDLGYEYPWRILSDTGAMIVVFIPLYASFQLRLGFGGGDVKLITAGSLFFGWPLGIDFLIVSFLIGGLFSTALIVVRMACKALVRAGVETPTIHEIAGLKEFPYAPAIAIAAIACFAVKFEGFY